MNFNAKKIIPFVALGCIFLGSSKCFAQEDYVKDFGVKIDQSADKVWTIKFTSKADYSTIGNGNISVFDETDNTTVNVILTKGEDDKTITITPPAEGYKAGHTYLIDVKKDVKSAKSKSLKREAKLEFKISGDVQTDSEVKFVRAMGEKEVVVQFNKEIDDKQYDDVKVLDENNNDIKAYAHRDYDNTKNLVIVTSESMYSPSVYKVQIGDKSYDFKGEIDRADAVKAVSAEAVGEKLIKVKLNRPIEDYTEVPEITAADTNNSYINHNLSYIDKSTVDVTLDKPLYVGDSYSFNVNGQEFKVNGVIASADKLKAISAEQDTKGPGRIKVKFNKEFFQNDMPEVRITDERGNSLEEYEDFTAYDINENELTIKIKNAAMQTGTYNLTIGDADFNITLNPVETNGIPNIVSVEAIASNILKITYDKNIDYDLVDNDIRVIDKDEPSSYIYPRFSCSNDNIQYVKLGSTLIKEKNYALKASGKSFNISILNDPKYNIDLDSISAVNESEIELKLPNTLPDGMPEYFFIDLFSTLYNQYGKEENSISTEESGDGKMIIFTGSQVFKPDSYYLEFNGKTYDIPSPTNKGEGLNVTSMALNGDKGLTINFNKSLDAQPNIGIYNYFDNWVERDYDQSKFNGNSSNLVMEDSTDFKKYKIVINGKCYYVKDYLNN